MRKIRFVDYLKDYLEFNNISNKDFANRIGITPKHLIDILSNKCELSSSIIDSISIVTNIPSITNQFVFSKRLFDYVQYYYSN